RLDGPAGPPASGGMVPFMPPPPICIDRPFHSAGSATPNRIGRAVGLSSTGKRRPLTMQCAGVVPDAATHVSESRTTAETGSPIRSVAIAAARSGDVQPDSANRRSCPSVGARAAVIDAWLIPPASAGTARISLVVLIMLFSPQAV